MREDNCGWLLRVRRECGRNFLTLNCDICPTVTADGIDNQHNQVPRHVIDLNSSTPSTTSIMIPVLSHYYHQYRG